MGDLSLDPSTLPSKFVSFRNTRKMLRIKNLLRIRIEILKIILNFSIFIEFTLQSIYVGNLVIFAATKNIY